MSAVMLGLSIIVAVFVFFGSQSRVNARELDSPIKVMAGDTAIDVDIGHAAPLVFDFDGDGNKDLLVGQFADGKLRLYRNVKSNKEPAFKSFTWFMNGAEGGQVPAG